jgi:hypothetical protein
MRTAGDECETTGKWFHLELDCHQETTVMASNGLGFVPSPHPSSTAEARLVQVERPGRACCGCCGCFANCCARGNDGWRGLDDGRLRGRGLGATGVIGGFVFVVAIVAIVLLILLVWSLDSFGDAVGSLEEGSGSGM